MVKPHGANRVYGGSSPSPDITELAQLVQSARLIIWRSMVQIHYSVLSFLVTFLNGVFMPQLQLHQILALVQPKSSDSALTALFKTYMERVSKEDLLIAKSAHFELVDEKDNTPAPQDVVNDNTLMTFNTRNEVSQLLDQLAPILDLEFDMALGNQQAGEPILVDGHSLFNDADGKPLKLPVLFLLTLEKYLDTLFDFVNKMATLPTRWTWTFDGNEGVYISNPTVKEYSRKTPKSLTKYEATKEHPAQCEVYHVESVYGKATRVQRCSAISSETKRKTLARISAIREAVNKARTTANCLRVETSSRMKAFLEALFPEILKPQ
jgi:hypothetical protein